MEFIVYCHQITSGSDVGMHFSATLQESKARVAEYRAALRQIDPTSEPLGALGIYAMALRMPDVATIIDILNSPESLLATCLVRKKLVTLIVD
ncbi:hypothetical protein [Rhizobium leguminosarum]|uniref:hypothetical protein n=1 Tax=Rhizobium leguminosarum TaxID=384 RepID=UPI001031DE04|nr:hypothetical protein [Rhizobium leguminosarum]TAX29815.1 hypothetical protein ELI04_08600 [Rhizobium leguminosarum]